MSNTYQNPIVKDGDFADPFVLKYNGAYYLYCTTPDIKCWSSVNLTDWKLEGAAIEVDTFPELVPFAPEVTYSNGKFYMYTSPSGFGHFALESENPTGPFHKISDNIQHAIDGSVFIDDDGKWYFYWAGDEGIWGCEMKSPTEFGKPVLTGVTMHGWTEGPFVCKQNGIYYMTYTGNHYLSKGYRINAAWSNHPLKGYQDERYNPVVIHTEGQVTGLGHSCTVMGPDLISHYLVYHNMNEDLTRYLDIDRQLWHENVTQILGPTRTPQSIPAMPDYAFPVGGRNLLDWHFLYGNLRCERGIYYSSSEYFYMISKQKFMPGFTAEFNILISACGNTGKRGIVLGEDKNRFFSLVFDKKTHSLQLWHSEQGIDELVKQALLPSFYIFETLHCIRVEWKRDGALSVFVDNRLQLQEDDISLMSVRIGYYSESGEIGCGYTAITHGIWEDASENVLIPIDCPFYPVFGTGSYMKKSDGSILLKEGQNAKYMLLADKDTRYRLFISVTSTRDTGKADIFIDKTKIGECTGRQEVQSYLIKLTAGKHTLMVSGNNGELNINRIHFLSIGRTQEKRDILLPVNIGPYEKKLWGKADWSDYKVTAVIKADLKENESRAGILLRATQSSEGGEGADMVLGIHFFIGYSVSLTGKELVVAKHRYDENILAACTYELESGKQYELHVKVQGAVISVYMNQDKAPRLTVIDSEPITNGYAGIWAKNSLVSVESCFLEREDI